MTERKRHPDESEGEEVVPIEGGYNCPSYSTVEQAVSLCERHGVPRDAWPIYYERPGGIPLDEVSRKCRLLWDHLSGIDGETIGSNWFLKVVWQWMSNGEVFYVDE